MCDGDRLEFTFNLVIAPEETLLNKAMATAVKILVNKLAGQIMPRSGH